MTPSTDGVLIIYAVLFLLSILAPIRWSLVTYFWLANVDLPDVGGGFSIFNMLKAFVLPAYFLWRLRNSPGKLLGAPGALLWAALTLYVGVAGLWSIFPLSALKFVGHLAGSLLICLVLVKAVAARKLGIESAPMIAFGALALAIARWFILPDYEDIEARFSSFVPAQAFAAFAAALYCILLFSRSLKPWIRYPMMLLLAVAVVLNGSRMWGSAILTATLLALMFSGIHKHFKVLGMTGFCLIVLAVFTFREPLMTAIAGEAGNNRIADAITAFGSGDNLGTGLGTWRFREEINALALTQIADSSPVQLIFGHGTSNAASVTGSLFRNYYAQGDRMDPNRMLHNEWVRVLYEWGLIGSILWIGFVVSICTLAWKGIKNRLSDAAKPLCVYLPVFLINLAGENILAGAGNAVNMGFLLIVALAYSAGRSPVRPRVTGSSCVRIPPECAVVAH